MRVAIGFHNTFAQAIQRTRMRLDDRMYLDFKAAYLPKKPTSYTAWVNWAAQLLAQMWATTRMHEEYGRELIAIVFELLDR